MKKVAFRQSADEVDAYDFVEVTAEMDEQDAPNPFVDASLSGEFTSPGAPGRFVEGFCDSPDGSVFRIRFMPTTAGEHSYSVNYRQGETRVSHEGSFRARDAGRRGLVKVDAEHPWHFAWEGTGEHYFWNGTTTYFLMGFRDEGVIRRAIDRLSALKTNRMRVLLFGRYDKAWGEPVVPTEDFALRLNPWRADRPDDVFDPGFDYSRFNVEHWQRYERMLRHAREKDMIVSVIFDISGPAKGARPVEGSEDERRYFRYGVARLAAFSNVTWDLGNEHDHYRKYPDWADALGPLVKKWDPYGHLTSAHNKLYRTSEWCDMTLLQNWDFDQTGVMTAQRKEQAETVRIIPQVNEEYGYEDLWEKTPGERSAATRINYAWKIYMAGCYQTAGETAKRGTGFPDRDSGGGWVNGRGDETMKMLESYGHIVDFFTGFEWWKAEPHNDLVEGEALCLAAPGSVYALYMYMARAGAAKINLESGEYRARWFDPRGGRYIDVGMAVGPTWELPEPPWRGAWAMLLER